MSANDPRGKFAALNEALSEEDETGSIEEVLDNNPAELSELLDTGSVTLKLAGKNYTLTLHVEEATS